MTVNQPSYAPTNKLSAAAIAAALASGSGLVVRNLWPAWYDDELWATMTPLLVLALGYIVKDRPNVAAEPDYSAGQ